MVEIIHQLKMYRRPVTFRLTIDFLILMFCGYLIKSIFFANSLLVCSILILSNPGKKASSKRFHKGSIFTSQLSWCFKQHRIITMWTSINTQNIIFQCNLSEEDLYFSP